MELKRNNLSNRFLLWYLDRDWENMPRSLCSYFWTLVLSVLTFPIGHLGRLFYKNVVPSWERQGFGAIGTLLMHWLFFIIEAILYTFITFVGFQYYYTGVEDPTFNGGWEYILFFLNGLAFFTVVFVILAASIFILFHLFSEDGVVRHNIIPAIRNQAIDEDTNKPKWLVLEYLNAVKAKICPLITYK